MVAFPALGMTDSLFDFAIQPLSVVNDLEVSLTNITPRSNFIIPSCQWISVRNKGTTAINPDIVYYPDNILIYDSASIVPTFITSDSIGWSLGPINPFQSVSIRVMMSKSPGISVNTPVITSVKVEPLFGDFSPVNNFDIDTTFFTASYDPNMITVSHPQVTINEVVSSSFLEYDIYFQNTGNDTAYYVRIDNLIPQELDFNSFEFLLSSHDMDIQYDYSVNPRKLSFTFNDIMLPDSSINEPESHGFIRYRIKPLATLSVGDSISNYVDIFFDFNPPVTTNQAITTIVNPTSINDDGINDADIKIFPNPSGGMIGVEFNLNQSGNVILEVYNLFGQKIRFLHDGIMDSGNHKLNFDLADIQSGVYAIRMQMGSDQLVRMVVIKSE
jgi:uncharacterized repeat protein (TIGR01451 family)